MWVQKAAISATLAAAVLTVAPGIAEADPTDAPPPPSPAAPSAVAASPTAPAPGAPKNTIDADGIYAVGTDIVPGVYASAGPVGDGTCFWKRLGSDGTTVDNALSKKPQVVTIDPTDKSFKTNGCQPWQLSDAPAPPQASGLAPALAGLQLQGFIAQLNARAAASGQAPTP